MKNLLKQINFSIIFLLIILLGGCEKTTTVYEPLRGDAIGYVELRYNSIADNRTKDYSGVEVTLEGSSPEIKTITDETGKFTFSDLESGVYNVIYNKEGFCKYKRLGYQFLGGNKPSSLFQTTIYEKTDVQIEGLNLDTFSGRGYVIVSATGIVNNIPEDAYPSIRFFLGNTPDISSFNYVATDAESIYSEGDFYSEIYLDTLDFPLGSDLYLIAYPSSNYSQRYLDINTVLLIYTGLNLDHGTEVKRIIIPNSADNQQ